MSENRMKSETTKFKKSKYALKHEAQLRGIFLSTSPFQSSKVKTEGEVHTNVPDMGE